MKQLLQRLFTRRKDAMADTGPQVVIVGAGFAGLYAARALARAPVRVTIVDRQNYHLVQRRGVGTGHGAGRRLAWT